MGVIDEREGRGVRPKEDSNKKKQREINQQKIEEKTTHPSCGEV